MTCPGWQPGGTCNAITTIPLGGAPGAGCGGAGCSGCGAAGAGCSGCGATLGEIGDDVAGCVVRTGGVYSVSASSSGEP